jgi:hypothetical protein
MNERFPFLDSQGPHDGDDDFDEDEDMPIL